MPAEERLAAFFCEQAQRIFQAAQELHAMVDGTRSADAHVAAIRTIEAAADTVARKSFLPTGLGDPVSTTHTITGAIVDVGAARRASAVRWRVATRIVYA